MKLIGSAGPDVILKKKGLIIDDYDVAHDILLKENYFFLNGYRHLFMNSASDRTFVTGATFDELYSLFLCIWFF